MLIIIKAHKAEKYVRVALLRDLSGFIGASIHQMADIFTTSSVILDIGRMNGSTSILALLDTEPKDSTGFI